MDDALTLESVDQKRLEMDLHPYPQSPLAPALRSYWSLVATRTATDMASTTGSNPSESPMGHYEGIRRRHEFSTMIDVSEGHQVRALVLSFDVSDYAEEDFFELLDDACDAGDSFMECGLGLEEATGLDRTFYGLIWPDERCPLAAEGEFGTDKWFNISIGSAVSVVGISSAHDSEVIAEAFSE